MATLRWTEEAATWLEEIYQYIARDNPQAASQTIQAIYDRAQIIKKAPGRKFQTATLELRALEY